MSEIVVTTKKLEDVFVSIWNDHIFSTWAERFEQLYGIIFLLLRTSSDAHREYRILLDVAALHVVEERRTTRGKRDEYQETNTDSSEDTRGDW